MKKNKYVIIKELLLKCAVILVLFFWYRCPIHFFTGMDCPGCGLTRAWKAAAILDFRTAFSFHPLFGVIGLEIVYFLFFKPLTGKQLGKKTENAIIILTLILLFVVWLYKIFILSSEG